MSKESQEVEMFTSEEMKKLKSVSRDQLEKISATVSAGLEKHDDELNDLKKEALKLWNKDVRNEKSALQFGKVLAKIKEILGHGKFTAWWTKEKFKQSRVSYCLRLAQGKIKPPDERRKSPRTEVLSSINKKVAALYDAIAKESDDDTLSTMIDEITADLNGLMLTVDRKKPAAAKKAKRQAAGK